MRLPERPIVNADMLVPPLPEEQARQVQLEKTPNIVSLPELPSIPDDLQLPVLLKVGSDISTDDIMPAGARVLPYWSNIPKAASFVFEIVDNTYPRRAGELRDRGGGHAIVAADNYGQGLEPRERRPGAALSGAPHGRGPELRPHPLAEPRQFRRPAADLRWSRRLRPDRARGRDRALGRACSTAGRELKAKLAGKGTITLRHDLSPRQLDLLLAGGVINWLRERLASHPDLTTDPEDAGRALVIGPG